MLLLTVCYLFKMYLNISNLRGRSKVTNKMAEPSPSTGTALWAAGYRSLFGWFRAWRRQKLSYGATFFFTLSATDQGWFEQYLLISSLSVQWKHCCSHWGTWTEDSAFIFIQRLVQLLCFYTVVSYMRGYCCVLYSLEHLSWVFRQQRSRAVEKDPERSCVMEF